MKDPENPTFQELIDFFKSKTNIKSIENDSVIMLDFQKAISNDEVYFLKLKEQNYTNSQLRNDEHLCEKKYFLLRLYREWEQTKITAEL